MNIFLKKRGIYLLLFALSLLAAWPLIKIGFYEPHDLHHLADIYQMYRAFQSGQIPPRFAPDFLYNLGHPLFNFYYVLPFYLGSLFFAVGLSLTTSFKLVFLTSIFMTVIGMYKFLSEFTGKYASLAGSILFLYTPYRAVQIYVRGAMGEMLALSLLPFVLWSVFRIIRNPEKKNISIFSLILALLLLSHNYFWMLALPFMVLFILVLIYKKDNRNELARKLTFGGILGAGIATYWWMPALLENKLLTSMTPFRVEDHFPFIKQLILPTWGYGSSVWGPYDEISFQIGVVNLLIVIASLGFVLLKRKKSTQSNTFTIFYWALGGFVVSLVLMNIRTLFFWKLIPFYQFIQFPWRFLMFTTLFTSVLAAVFVENMKDKYKKWTSIVLVFMAMILTISYFKPSKTVNKSDDVYLRRMFATRTTKRDEIEVGDDYRNYSEDYLLLPKWTDEKPDKLPSSEIEIISGHGKLVQVDKRSAVNYQIKLNAESPLDLALNKMYFPGWSAFLDSEKVEIEPHKPYGAIKIVNIPRGEHEVKFKWKETNLRRLSDYISVLSLAIVIMLLSKKIQLKRNA